MNPYPWKRNLSRSLWDRASTSSSSVDQLLLSIRSKQHTGGNLEQYIRRRLVDLPKPIYSMQWAAAWRKQRRFGMAGPGPGVGGVALPGVWELGTITSWYTSMSLRVTALFCGTPACSEVAFHFSVTLCSHSGKPSAFSGLWTQKSICQPPAEGTQYRFSGPKP